ncbi:HNH endonuclease [Vogesella sp. LIG4]|uniref:HNH endonuclease n=1 Tax=Vogesella sp. LIG4 TaxID=1192162 RepID=UPI0012FDF683|nr:HNH endonuclease signature motif containing protein [Vogesella sp. LIG4]
MKNLNPLDAPFNHYFNRIVDGKNNTVKGKQNAAKKTLESLKNIIAQHYTLYTDKFKSDTLFTLPTSTYGGQQKEHLLQAYTGGGEALDGLKAFIKAAQPTRLQGTCQYCGISIPKTMDHYVPKEDFPEFAVMALNLVPCCGECNGHKLAYWKDSNTRGIINFYRDPIPNVRFLFVTLVWSGNFAIPTFFIENSGNIDGTLFSIIEKHFSRLHLLSRYKDQSNDFITDTIDSVVSNADNPDPQTISNNLHGHVSKIESRLGVNSWKAVLLQALASEARFITLLSTKIARKVDVNKDGDEDD